MKQGTGIENDPKQTGEINVEWSDRDVKNPEKKANMKNHHRLLSVRKNRNNWKWEQDICSKN